MSEQLRIILPTKIWNSLPPELWSYVEQIVEAMEYEDLWKKQREKIKEKKIRKTLRIYYENLFYKGYGRDCMLEMMDKKAKEYGINNFRERMYNKKEQFLSLPAPSKRTIVGSFYN